MSRHFIGTEHREHGLGDDTPMAVLSAKQRPLYDYFRQQFAQVTNPAIDPLREAIVMSLETCVGAERNVFEETAEHANRAILSSPVMSPAKWRTLMNLERPGFAVQRIELNVAADMPLGEAVKDIALQAEAAVREGKTLLVLSDRYIEEGKLPVHAALAVGAVHHHLIEVGLRCDCNILVETATARDPHHYAVLIGFGATAVYPYLAYEVLGDLIRTGEVIGDLYEVFKSYRKGISKGLLKILSKMGISTIVSYRGAQLFEAVGLADEIVDVCFRGVVSRIQGARFSDLQMEQGLLANEAWNPRKAIQQGGLLKFIFGGEYHAYNPDVVRALQDAVQGDSYDKYLEYAGLVNSRPVASLRDLLRLRDDQTPIDIDQVEPLESIFKRFDSAGISLGALSPEAHEAIAEAMNRLGARSNSGEGGEDPARYGTSRSSKIKQIASGRFGVTPEYLVNADVLQIKVAQGAKPGEGGQLPGGKVNELIARLRYAVPGVTLISPPPHHDIYSIEDLAQLIYDLKNANPEARISVKLVSEAGVGTVAAGVAKAKADHILISGHSGGTGASPQTSIMHAGLPWEMGLADAHQMLTKQGLRNRVSLETDGGLRTGRDVVIGALLGAREFGFSTAPLISLGCIMMRKCHLNTCPVGIATQDPELRAKFDGTPEQVINYFYLIAEEVRSHMARLGVRTFNELVGRTDRLLPHPDAQRRGLELGSLLTQGHVPAALREDAAATAQDHGLDEALDHALINQAAPALNEGTPVTLDVPITNQNRTVGTLLSRAVVQAHGDDGLPTDTITLRCTGTAGQSFAAFGMRGLTFDVRGIANDYLGKGLSGARIVLRPPEDAGYRPEDATVTGNVALYGATSGRLLCRGQAGERFAVRNSGAEAVVEGVGDHGCEYMTGGCVVVLGSTGRNFAAGMSGGLAYVWDRAGTFRRRCNTKMVDLHDVPPGSDDALRIHQLVDAHHNATGSPTAQTVLDRWPDICTEFVKVFPKAFKDALKNGPPFEDVDATPAEDEAVVRP
ncbi:MAG: glutamate synthase large subunit [Longimonas sp.]